MMISLYNTRSKATLKTQRLHNIYKYFVTFELSQKKLYATPEMLITCLLKLKLRHHTIRILNSVFELGYKYKQLHLHVIITLSHKIIYKENNIISGIRLYWKPIYNTLTLIKYLSKDSKQYTQSDIFTLNYLNHNYGFVSNRSQERAQFIKST